MPQNAPAEPPVASRGALALSLSGGGARAAYQVGFLCALARHLPEVRFPLITGVSAGAINAAFLAAHGGPPTDAAAALSAIWGRLTVEDIFRVSAPSLARDLVGWGTYLASGGSAAAPEVRGLLDTRPLYATIRRGSASVDGEMIGIARNLAAGRLRAIALSALNYNTGQTVTWVQGEPLAGARPGGAGKTVPARLTARHVMASSALPIFFPAVRLGDAWYGDGSVRLLSPLAPALHLGARRILAISTRYAGGAAAPQTSAGAYPPPARILSHLLNAVFLDVFEQDVDRLEQVNQLLRRLPPEEHGDLRPVEILVLRPSENLGALAATYEPALPAAFRYLIRSLGTRDTPSDFLSYLLFQPDFLTHLMAIGERDAEARLPEIRKLVEGGEE
jgi:NTE family protein